MGTVEALIERLAGVRMLVVGDAMLDEYVEGDAERILPEAPIPVVRVTGTTTQPGGAANVALNATTLGAVVDLAAVVGNDEAGQRLVALLGEASVGTAFVVRADDRLDCARFASWPGISKSSAWIGSRPIRSRPATRNCCSTISHGSRGRTCSS